MTCSACFSKQAMTDDDEGPGGSSPGPSSLLLPLHHKPGKPRRFQLFQHPVGVGADGEGPHLDPVQGIALGGLGGLGGT